MSSSPENGARTPNLENPIEAARQGSPEALGGLLEECRQYLLLVANRELRLEWQAKVGPSDDRS